MQPRTSPLQSIPSRPARGKYGVQSRRSAFSIRGADTIPGYVQSLYPSADVQTKKSMTNAIRRYMDTPAGLENGVPTPAMCVHLFDGLIDD